MRNVLLSLLTSVSLAATATSAFAMEAKNERSTIPVHPSGTAEITEKDQNPIPAPQVTPGIYLLTDDLWSYFRPFLQTPRVVFESNKTFHQPILNHVSHLEITDTSVSKLTNLTSLSLRYDNQITDTSVSSLTNLTSLNLGDNRKITDDGLSPLTNLTSLNLGDNRKITDTSVSKLPNLRSLHLAWNTKITPKGYSHIQNLHLIR